MKKIVTLSDVEDKEWISYFIYAKTQLHYSDNKADTYAWRQMQTQFPRLSLFNGCR